MESAVQVRSVHKTFLSTEGPATRRCHPEIQQKMKTFEEALDSSLYNDLYKDSVDVVVDYLCNPSTIQRMHNFYLQTTKEKLRTALVKCSFTDVNIVVDMVCRGCEEKDFYVIHVSAKPSLIAIKSAITASTSNVLLVVDQLDCMEGDVIDGLLSLLPSCVSPSFSISILMCVSTCRSVLASRCSMSILESLSLEFFSFPSPVQQAEHIFPFIMRFRFDNSISIGADLLKSLRYHFLNVDFSLAEVKRIIGLSIVEHHFKHGPDAKMVMNDSVEEYWKYFDVLVDLMVEFNTELAERVDPVDVHIKLQTSNNFWNDERIIVLRSRMTESTFPKETLIERCNHIREKLQSTDPFFDEIADILCTSEPIRTTFTPSKKMTSVELAKKQREHMTSRGSSPRGQVVNGLFSILRLHLCPWDEIVLSCPPGVAIPSVHNTLATHPKQGAAAVYQQLSEAAYSKPVSLSELSARSALPSGEFFAWLGQLELMGILKEAGRGNDHSVKLLYKSGVHVA